MERGICNTVQLRVHHEWLCVKDQHITAWLPKSRTDPHSKGRRLTIAATFGQAKPVQLVRALLQAGRYKPVPQQQQVHIGARTRMGLCVRTACMHADGLHAGTHGCSRHSRHPSYPRRPTTPSTATSPSAAAFSTTVKCPASEDPCVCVTHDFPAAAVPCA